MEFSGPAGSPVCGLLWASGALFTSPRELPLDGFCPPNALLLRALCEVQTLYKKVSLWPRQ